MKIHSETKEEEIGLFDIDSIVKILDEIGIYIQK
jgi:hypothetical protein